MSVATVTLTASTADFRREIAEAAARAAQQLREIGDSARRHMGAAFGHVRASAGEMSSAVERAASLMGGAFGDTADIVLDLGGKMGGLLGPIGLATAGVAGLGYASVQLAGYADEAARRLEAAGLAAMIPAESQASLDRYREGTAALRTEADLLAVTMGGPLLDAIGDMSLALTGLAEKASDVTTPLGTIRGALAETFGSGAGRVMLAISTGGASELARAFSGAAESAVEAGEAISAARTEEAGAAKAAEEAAKREASARDQATKATTRQAAAVRSEAQAISAVSDALADELAQRRALQAAQARDAAETARIASAEATLAQNAAQVGATSAGLTDLMGLVDAAGSQIGIAAAKGLLPILTGGGAGVLGAVGAAGPVGAALVAVTQIPSVIEGIDDTLDDLTQTFQDLPDLLRSALTETVPDILRDLPDLVGAVLDVVVDLPVILAEAIPEVLAGLISAIPEILAGVIEGFGQWLRTLFFDLPKAIAQAIGDALNPFSRGPEGDRNFLGTNLTAQGGRRLFGIDLPEFSRGTSEITRTGVALVHRGEEIRRASEPRSSGRTAPVINVYGPDTREIVRQLREHLGGDYGPTYGLGDDLP